MVVISLAGLGVGLNGIRTGTIPMGGRFNSTDISAVYFPFLFWAGVSFWLGLGIFLLTMSLQILAFAIANKPWSSTSKIIYFVAIPVVLCAGFLYKPSYGTKLVEGGLYLSQRDDNTTYVVYKILKITDRGVHLRQYSNVFLEKPSKIDERSLFFEEEAEAGIDHVAFSYYIVKEMEWEFIKKVRIIKDDLAGYNKWLKGRRNYL
jgi:hypothetical protein